MPLAAVGQIRSTADLTHNLHQCQSLVKKASEAGAAALFLPEAADYINTNPSLKLCKSVDDSEFVQGLLKSAREHRLPIHVGIHEPASGDKTKNTLIWINEEGKITHRYQKLHLFDVDIAGGPSLQESKSVERGSELPEPFDSPLGKIGPQICFDMRFPEPGLTMIVDPWGKVIAELGGEADEKGRGLDEGEIALAEIDTGYVEKIRQEIPLTRRTDVYAALK
ncbi:Carbon-nitrogen hydrolase [Didymella pomorum]